MQYLQAKTFTVPADPKGFRAFQANWDHAFGRPKNVERLPDGSIRMLRRPPGSVVVTCRETDSVSR